MLEEIPLTIPSFLVTCDQKPRTMAFGRGSSMIQANDKSPIHASSAMTVLMVRSDSDSSRTECSSRPRLEGSPSCVETTVYALRALLQVGDVERTACLAQWLVQIKSGHEGFYI